MDLRSAYKRFVEGKYLYRASSEEWLDNIRKEGLDPSQNPYEDVKQQLIEFFTILDRLEAIGHNYVYMYWPDEKPLGSKISRIHRRSLDQEYIDLTPDEKEIEYYMDRRGGDIPHTVNHIAQDIQEYYPLTDEEKELVRRLRQWSLERMEYSMVKIGIAATSKYLEDAEFQRFGLEYIGSPFGTFDNFKDLVEENGWNT